MPASNRKTVLIGFADALAAPEVAWSLVDGGFDVVAFARRGSRPALGRSRTLRIVEIESPEVDATGAVESLEAAARRCGAVALMPLDDAAVWLCAHAAFAGLALVGPSGPRARLALDKELQLEAAGAAGFEVPTTQVLTSSSKAATVELPAVVKSAAAIEDAGGRLRRAAPVRIGNAIEFEQMLPSLLARSPRLLAQPLLPGIGEGVFGLVADGEVVALSAHRRIRMMNPAGSGSSACVSIAVDPKLAAGARVMARESEWTGLFMLEFLRDPQGQAWFMELNGRPWGSMALARRCGFDYPLWAVRAALDPAFRVPGPPVVPGIVCRHLGRELVHLLMVLRGPRTGTGAWPSRWATLREMLRFGRGDCWYNWRRGEASFFVADAVATVASQIKPKR
jgi:hypothetical protein